MDLLGVILVSSALMSAASCVFHSLKVSDLLVRVESLPTVRPEDPVITAGMAIRVLGVEAVAVYSPAKGIHGVFTGYNFLSLLEKSPEAIWQALYKTRCYEVDWRPLSARPEEGLIDVLRRMYERKRGYVIIPRPGEPPLLMGVIAVLKLLAERSGRVGIPVGELATPGPISLAPDSTVHELIKTMIGKGVRRVLIGDRVATDRDVVRYLLEREVDALRSSPLKALQRRIGDLLGELPTPAVVERGRDVGEAFRLVAENPSYTAVTSDWGAILTPWDLTVKLCNISCRVST